METSTYVVIGIMVALFIATLADAMYRKDYSEFRHLWVGLPVCIAAMAFFFILFYST